MVEVVPADGKLHCSWRIVGVCPDTFALLISQLSSHGTVTELKLDEVLNKDECLHR